MTIGLTSQVYVGQGPIFDGPANLLRHEDYLLQKSCTWDDRSISNQNDFSYF